MDMKNNTAMLNTDGTNSGNTIMNIRKNLEVYERIVSACQERFEKCSYYQRRYLREEKIIMTNLKDGLRLGWLDDEVLEHYPEFDVVLRNLKINTVNIGGLKKQSTQYSPMSWAGWILPVIGKEGMVLGFGYRPRESFCTTEHIEYGDHVSKYNLFTDSAFGRWTDLRLPWMFNYQARKSNLVLVPDILDAVSLISNGVESVALISTPNSLAHTSNMGFPGSATNVFSYRLPGAFALNGPTKFHELVGQKVDHRSVKLTDESEVRLGVWFKGIDVIHESTGFPPGSI